MTKPYSDEIIAGIDQFEEKYDIELVSIEHHQECLERCERLETQRGKLLEVCKTARRFTWSLYRESGKLPEDPARQMWLDLKYIIDQVEGNDANTSDI